MPAFVLHRNSFLSLDMLLGRSCSKRVRGKIVLQSQGATRHRQTEADAHHLG